MTFEFTPLGVGAAIPIAGRHTSAHILNIQDQIYLIDCGEGTQMQLGRYAFRRSRIKQIFISHLHGDHVLGLIGLLTSYSLLGRDVPMQVFGPTGIKAFIEANLTHTHSYIPYELNIHELDPTIHSRIFENQAIEVFSFPLLHRVPTCGYLFREKQRPPRINIAALERYDIPKAAIRGIKMEGDDFTTEDGEIIPNATLTLPPYPSRSFAYCSDTAYNEALVPIIKGVDLLYHEATYLNRHYKQAEFSMHSTAQDAATIAKLAAVQQLLIGHYSSRYLHVDLLREEAQYIFPNTALALEGEVYKVPLERKPERIQ